MPATRSSPVPRAAVGCGLVAVALLGAAAYGWHRWSVSAEEAQRQAEKQQEDKARTQFEPAMTKLQEGAQPDKPYDIDETIRVIHGIDTAMKDQKSMQDYLALMARQDYRDVAPDVLRSRRRILEILFPLYAKRTQADEQQATWEFTSQLLLSSLSIVSVSGDVGIGAPKGSFSVDREQAQKVLSDLEKQQEEHEQLEGDIRALDNQLFQAMLDYSDTYWKHMEEWDRLCTLRDRAYLAVHDGDWGSARAAAQAAADMAPKEREAHLLLAQALIEGGNPEDLDEARQLLAGYVEQHPDSTAPAFLLLGTLEEKQGNHDQALIDFQQSAAYYPKQADALTDMLDPYQQRQFLRKSREGGYILELYKSEMLGAGYWSPDLQMAKVAFDSGDFEGGRKKVLDHFARRRSQQQWDFVLSDLQFAHDLLGDDFKRIFPDDAWLDLVVKPTMWGGKLSVAVTNRSDRALHNATLVLAVHFTDMHPDDYATFTPEKTQPAVMPHATTDFGDVDVTWELQGKPKGVEDIVTDRAILVTDEAVLWVDTDEFKVAESKEFHQGHAEGHAEGQGQGTSPPPRTSEIATSLDDATASLGKAAGVSTVSRYGKDDLVVDLPSSLSILHPTFDVRYGDQHLQASSNEIDGDRIELTFAGVDNLDADDSQPKQVVVTVGSAYGGFEVSFDPDGKSWKLGGVRRTHE